ncbi:MAG TPA: PmoA family protein [Chitinophagaceae bacterium]|nr:PmoA family protein [Chitinophagaceae bacterium]
MKNSIYLFHLFITAILFQSTGLAQNLQPVRVIKSKTESRIDVLIGDKLFTSFLYPDTLEKPVLYPVRAANSTIVTRGFPMQPRAGDPTDHPHHTGIWFTYENINGLDFWNNSYAIPAEKKYLYGWIRTDRIIKTSGGKQGVIIYHANWTDQQKKVLLEETTQLIFSGTENTRIIDRVTTLKAVTDVTFTDAKDGMYGIRLAHELQIPDKADKEYKDNKGNITIVKAVSDSIANGNYLTSEGKTGDSAWGTRGMWCKVFGKMGSDSVSITIIDHPGNPGYPTFWHARGYGLFAANPLGQKIFSNGKLNLNFQMKKGQSATFRYRMIIQNGNTTLSAEELNKEAGDFAKER